MTHILIVSVHPLHRGRSGAAIHLCNVAQGLRMAGDRVTLLEGPMVHGEDPLRHVAGLEVLARRLKCLLHDDPPDVALLWGHLGQELPLARQLRGAGVPLILEHPAADVVPVEETLALVDGVVVPSQFALGIFAEQTGRDGTVIGACLRPCRCSMRAGSLARAGVGRMYVVSIINPEPPKGLSVVLLLIRAVARMRLPIIFRLVESRWRVPDLATLGLSLEEARIVEVIRYRDDSCSLYAETDLLLVPSLWQESFGMVAREAVVHGVPVVASRVGGIPEAVGDGGILLDPPTYDDTYAARMSGSELRAWLEAVVEGLQRGRRSMNPAADSTALHVASYRALLTSWSVGGSPENGS